MKIRALLFLLILALSLLISSCVDNPDPGVTPPPVTDIPTEKKDVDMSGVSFRSYSFVYDGTEKHISIIGMLPEGVTSVSYLNNGKVDVGVYEVVASFSVAEGYNKPEDMTANITITKADLDMKKYQLKSASFTYDGTEKNLAISDLPAGVTVSYTGNAQTEVGEYKVVASFDVSDNYNKPNSVSATLKITKANYDLSGIVFTDTNLEYTGKAQSIFVTGELPEGLSVSYLNNKKTAIGSYTVTAVFTNSNPNYNTPDNMRAVLTISSDKVEIIGLVFNGREFEYDGTEKSLTVLGNIPEGVVITYTNNGKIDAGKYLVTASFSVPDGYINPGEKTAVLTINKAAYEDFEVSFEDKSFNYDGEAKSLAIVGKLPEGLRVTYQNNAKTEPGKHTVTAVFVSDNPNYVTPCNMTATLSILPVDTSEGLVFGDVNGMWGVTGYTGSSPFVVIGDSYGGKTIEAIANSAFSGNTNITSVVISDSVKSIGNHAFRGCTSLASVTFGEGLEVIGAAAFRGCTCITTVVLPDSLKIIGDGAFEDTNLVAITLPFVGGMQRTSTSTSSKEFLGYIFGAANYVGNLSSVPESLRTVILSKACTVIPYSAFYGCSNIETIIIQNGGVRLIENSAFSGCTSIKSIYLPASITKIPANEHYYNSPFYMCTALENIKVEFDMNNADLGKYWNYTSSSNTAEQNIEIVYKDGASGMLNLTQDDADLPTARVINTLFKEEYTDLKLTFSIIVDRLVSMKKQYNDDGTYVYVQDEQGNYMYTTTSAYEEWKQIVGDGSQFNVASHTMTHYYFGKDNEGGWEDSNGDGTPDKYYAPNNVTIEVDVSGQILRVLFEGQDVLGFIIAGVDRDQTQFTKDYMNMTEEYDALRHTFYGINDPDNLNWRQMYSYSIKHYETSSNASTNSSSTYDQVKDVDIDKWRDYIDQTIKQNGWGIFTMHKIIKDGATSTGFYIYEFQFRALCDYIREKQESGELWCATYDESIKYVKQMQSSTVRAINHDDEFVEVYLTDTLDNSKYDMELTVKVEIPDEWETAVANGDILTIHEDEQGKFVYVNVAPDAGSVAITQS